MSIETFFPVRGERKSINAYTVWTQGHAGRSDRHKDAANLQLWKEKLTLRLIIIIIIVVVVVVSVVVVFVVVIFIGYAAIANFVINILSFAGFPDLC